MKPRCTWWGLRIVDAPSARGAKGGLQGLSRWDGEAIVKLNRQQIQERAMQVLEANPQGIRWMELDDRFHETGIHGTDDLLADSSFAIG